MGGPKLFGVILRGAWRGLGGGVSPTPEVQGNEPHDNLGGNEVGNEIDAMIKLDILLLVPGLVQPRPSGKRCCSRLAGCRGYLTSILSNIERIYSGSAGLVFPLSLLIACSCAQIDIFFLVCRPVFVGNCIAALAGSSKTLLGRVVPQTPQLIISISRLITTRWKQRYIQAFVI